uniref:CDP-diacylglycerol--inositol 3-phosphatidyltransferase n=1 Tax=Rhabditophanes sp. KR3021 TaxID=114890 RepID=A0AC35TLN9_9BILA
MTVSAFDVMLYYPNQIGYARIWLAFISFIFMQIYPGVSIICYGISGLLDAVDGYLARAYNQSSRFGAMLDQLTDRLTFAALLMILCVFYPKWTFVFQSIVIIDIASHWLHLHATDLTGKGSHKSSDNPILNLYYTSRPVLFFMCLGNEAFFGLLYVLHFWTGPTILTISVFKIAAVLLFPVAAVKCAISVLHLFLASKTVADYDADKQNKTQ